MAQNMVFVFLSTCALVSVYTMFIVGVYHESRKIMSLRSNRTSVHKPFIDMMCLSSSGYNLEVLSSIPIRFMDNSTALVANTGGFNGMFTNGEPDWFRDSLPFFEPVTILIFRALITPDTVYVGFGEWVGPTILYSAQLAKASYGFEPDKFAFRKLALNTKANQCFWGRLNVYDSCIYSHAGNKTFSNGYGNSMSSIQDFFALDSVGITTVQCITLEHALTSHQLLDERLFFKVDTEGAEAVLIPSFVQLVRKLKHKPIWYISKHANTKYVSSEIQEGFKDLVGLYQCHRAAPASHQTRRSSKELLNFRVSDLPSINNEIMFLSWLIQTVALWMSGYVKSRICLDDFKIKALLFQSHG
jgi:FkbM family methyltransferase